MTGTACRVAWMVMVVGVMGVVAWTRHRPGTIMLCVECIEISAGCIGASDDSLGRCCC